MNKKDDLKHYGVPGMKWGVINEDEPTGLRDRIFSDKLDHKQKNAELLKKNPDAHVLNYDAFKKKPTKAEEALAQKRKETLKKVAIGVGIGVGVAAAAAIYLKNKKAVDGFVTQTMNKIGNKPIDKLPDTEVKDLKGLLSDRAKDYQKLRIPVKTDADATACNYVAGWLKADQTRYVAISAEEYSKFSTEPLTIKAGQMFSRVTHDSAEKLRDWTYASFDEDDVHRYNCFLPALRKANNPLLDVKSYKMSFEALTEIRSPSKKERVDILVDVLKSYPAAELRGNDPKDYALKVYNTFAAKLIDRDAQICKDYMAEVVKRGYNAIVDDNDAGRLAKAPMILLDAKLFKSNGISRITKDVLQDSYSKLKPLNPDIETLDTVKDIVNGLPGGQEILKSFIPNMKG